MARDYFDTENFEASVIKYLRTQLKDYTVMLDESTQDFKGIKNWFFIEFLGNNGQTKTQPPVNHIMVHLRATGESADADLALMMRLAETNLKDKIFDLYDTEDKNIVGKLRGVILRGFPKETARQANSSRGFNRSILIKITYGKVGVAYV